MTGCLLPTKTAVPACLTRTSPAHALRASQTSWRCYLPLASGLSAPRGLSCEALCLRISRSQGSSWHHSLSSLVGPRGVAEFSVSLALF